MNYIGFVLFICFLVRFSSSVNLFHFVWTFPRTIYNSQSNRKYTCNYTQFVLIGDDDYNDRVVTAAAAAEKSIISNWIV